ncbi:MAG: uroD [Firmicutes bacterium]|nr:uroD [Bacillota bacterium]
MSKTELYNVHLERIKKAIALEKTDRVPVIPVGNSFCANHLGVSLADFAMNNELAADTMLKSFSSLGDIDGMQQPVFSPYLLSYQWLSKVRIPGIDLPKDVPWQVAEAEMMTVDDYDVIINKGYNTFFKDFLKNRLDNLEEKVNPVFAYTPQAIENCKKEGLVTLSPIVCCIPYEVFCGGRTMVKFMRDLFRLSDKVQAAMDIAMDDIVESTRQVLRAMKPTGAWVGGWRGASEFLSPKVWNRFEWPYFKRMVEVVLEENVIPVLHIDSNWERDLEKFLELPKGKCIFSSDHATNIYKVKEVLGDHMCIMGDVPAALTSLGTPDEVYNYSTKLINEIGPKGFILSSGCDIPFNAKPENVKAMIAAVTDK